MLDSGILVRYTTGTGSESNAMKTFTFNTGRVYDGEQNLIIDVYPRSKPDEFGFYDAEVHVADASRYMNIYMNMVIASTDTPQEIGRIALRMYDQGRYHNI